MFVLIYSSKTFQRLIRYVLEYFKHIFEASATIGYVVLYGVTEDRHCISSDVRYIHTVQLQK